MKVKSRIIVKRILSEDKFTIKYSLKLPHKIKKFFNGNTFFVKYKGEDITTVPESIRIIPLLSNVVPIAWANNSDIIMQEVDKIFFSSLKKIRQSFKFIYPEINWEGNIVPGKVVNDTTKDYIDKDRSALLFTGGIDSVTSFYRHISEKPVLINVQGTDISLNGYVKFKIVEDELTNFADYYTTDIKFIESNFRSFINNSILNTFFEKQLLNFGWWAGIQHGLGLTGLCAPLAFKRKISKIYIASSFTKNFLKQWGSSPLIDNKVKFFFTGIKHDDYEFSRQDKLEYLSDYLLKKNYNLKLNVCASKGLELNCSECEKCSRTMIGLLIAGIDPDRLGFDTKKFSFNSIIEKFEKGVFKVTDDELFMWEDIKKHLNFNKEPIVGNTIIPEYFLYWLKNTSFDKYKESYIRKKKRYKIVKSTIKYFPQLYNMIYKFYLRYIKNI